MLQVVYSSIYSNDYNGYSEGKNTNLACPATTEVFNTVMLSDQVPIRRPAHILAR